MYTGLQHFHSYWAYAALIFTVIAIFAALAAVLGKKPFTNGYRQLALVGLITTHIQVTIGLVLYWISPITQAAFADFGKAMKTPELRLYAVEHPLMVIIGVALITMGFSKMKKAETDIAKHKKIVLFYSLGIIAILSRLPYAAWF